MGVHTLPLFSSNSTPRPRQPAKQQTPQPGEPVEDGGATERAIDLGGAVVVAGTPLYLHSKAATNVLVAALLGLSLTDPRRWLLRSQRKIGCISRHFS